MKHLASMSRILLAASCASLASPALAEGFTLTPLGDSTVAPLGGDRLAVTSDAGTPMAAFAGQTVRIRFESADVAPSEVQVGAAVSVGGASAGTFTLTFDGRTTPASHFGGRLLTAKDLTADQDYVRYRPIADWLAAQSYTFVLSRGGVAVAVADVDDGVAPFTLDRAPDAFAVEVRPRAGGQGGQQIEIHAWSFGQSTATTDGGASLVFDTLEVHGHEVGHALGLSHDIGARSVGMIGVDTMVLTALPDEAALADVRVVEARVSPDGRGGLDMRSTALGGVDARCVSDALGATSLVGDVVLRLAPAVGHELRLRARVAGGGWGAWGAWTTLGVERRVEAPVAGGETFDDYEVELRRSAASPTIASSGYIRVKKLNSGG